VTKIAIFQNSRWRTAAILTIALSPYPSRELFDSDQHWYSVQISIPRADFCQKIENLQIQDGGRTPYWKSFLAISWRNNGRLMQNLEWRWRITCRYRSRDQIGNFWKFKMADGRRFENSFISISQPWIIRFLSNFVRWCKFPFRGWAFAKDGGRTPYWKSYFGCISATYWPINAKFGPEMKNHMQI